jgi:membrane fusion protein (multidrug efflux system)
LVKIDSNIKLKHVFDIRRAFTYRLAVFELEIYMIRKIIIGFGIVLVVLIALAGVKAMQIRTLLAFAASYTPPPETVASMAATEENWPNLIPAVGSVSAVEGVTVSPEIAGKVVEIDFESGATIQKGDLLVKLDSESEQAQLRAAQAQVELSKLNIERQRRLRADKTISQSELDQAEAEVKQNEANADAIQATIDKKNICAPFSGKLGIRLVNLGEQLDVGKSIVSLQSVGPVFVDFTLPQQDLAHLRTGLNVLVTADVYPGTNFTGELVAINPDLDVATRSVRLRTKIENAGELLRPGMFVHAEVEMADKQTVLAIPATAVFASPDGDSVYVINYQATNSVTNAVVQQKLIRTGTSHGDFISVAAGLKPGDRVVTAGVFKLRSGMTVQENNDATPKAMESPNPPNS